MLQVYFDATVEVVVVAHPGPMSDVKDPMVTVLHQATNVILTEIHLQQHGTMRRATGDRLSSVTTGVLQTHTTINNIITNNHRDPNTTRIGIHLMSKQLDRQQVTRCIVHLL